MMPASIEPKEALTMGTFADFKCKCGYEAFGKWGIGMNPIYREQKISLAPALCKDCRELVNINENAVLPKCRECGGFNVIFSRDPGLGKPGRKSVKKTRTIYKELESSDSSEPDDSVQAELSDEEDFDGLFDDDYEIKYYIEGVDVTFYLCPKCNQFSMEKTGGGLFD